MTQINAYLAFNGNCTEAMTFYKDCLGGELTLMAVKDSPMADQLPATMQQSILHSELKKDGLVLLASDTAGAEGQIHGNTISLALACSTEEEIKKYFSNLSKDGQVIRPLHSFFAGTMGVLKDKYGMTWMLKH